MRTKQNRNILHFALTGLTICIVLAFSGFAQVAPTFAASHHTSPSKVPTTKKAKTVKMVSLSCTNLKTYSQEVQSIISKHSLCKTSGRQTSTAAGVQPNGTVWGDCGSSTLITYWSGGVAVFYEALYSTQGDISLIYYTDKWSPVNWWEAWNYGSQDFAGANFPPGPYWGNEDYIGLNTIVHYITQFTAVIAMTDGSLCVAAGATDTLP